MIACGYQGTLADRSRPLDGPLVKKGMQRDPGATAPEPPGDVDWRDVIVRMHEGFVLGKVIDVADGGHDIQHLEVVERVLGNVPFPKSSGHP